jgi:hypothetical protein
LKVLEKIQSKDSKKITNNNKIKVKISWYKTNLDLSQIAPQIFIFW